MHQAKQSKPNTQSFKAYLLTHQKRYHQQTRHQSSNDQSMNRANPSHNQPIHHQIQKTTNKQARQSNPKPHLNIPVIKHQNTETGNATNVSLPSLYNCQRTVAKPVASIFNQHKRYRLRYLPAAFDLSEERVLRLTQAECQRFVIS